MCSGGWAKGSQLFFVGSCSTCGTVQKGRDGLPLVKKFDQSRSGYYPAKEAITSLKNVSKERITVLSPIFLDRFLARRFSLTFINSTLYEAQHKILDSD
jgi:ACT domain-containing protein